MSDGRRRTAARATSREAFAHRVGDVLVHRDLELFGNGVGARGESAGPGRVRRGPTAAVRSPAAARRSAAGSTRDVHGRGDASETGKGFGGISGNSGSTAGTGSRVARRPRYARADQENNPARGSQRVSPGGGESAPAAPARRRHASEAATAVPETRPPPDPRLMRDGARRYRPCPMSRSQQRPATAGSAASPDRSGRSSRGAIPRAHQRRGHEPLQPALRASAREQDSRRPLGFIDEAPVRRILALSRTCLKPLLAALPRRAAAAQRARAHDRVRETGQRAREVGLGRRAVAARTSRRGAARQRPRTASSARWTRTTPRPISRCARPRPLRAGVSATCAAPQAQARSAQAIGGVDPVHAHARAAPRRSTAWSTRGDPLARTTRLRRRPSSPRRSAARDRSRRRRSRRRPPHAGPRRR